MKTNLRVRVASRFPVLRLHDGDNGTKTRLRGEAKTARRTLVLALKATALTVLIVLLAISRGRKLYGFVSSPSSSGSHHSSSSAASSPRRSFDVANCTPSMLEAAGILWPPRTRRGESCCPEATWLEEHYAALHEARRAASASASASASPPGGSVGEGGAPASSAAAATAVYVGCNKGYDAVNSLRMLSADPFYNKTRWREALIEYGGGNARVARGVCGQHESEQFRIPAAAEADAVPVPPRRATVHCIEPMARNFASLNASAGAVGYAGRGLVVARAAVGGEEGTVRFPTGVQGWEHLSIAMCGPGVDSKEYGGKCEEVDLVTLDGYFGRFLPRGGDGSAAEPDIDVLSIDTEGHDIDVLLGARDGTNNVLHRTKYLEFEYHTKGQWRNHSVREAVDLLDEDGFTCYWMGKGRVFRITGCWLDQYDNKMFANVACVKRTEFDLAERMEKLFQAQLESKE